MIITGRNAIREALRAGNVKSLSVLSRLDKDPVVKEARGLNVPVKLVDDNELTRMAKNSSHQGFVAISKDLETVTLDELIQSAKNTTYPLLLMLDGIEDPQNLGAIIRSAACLGFSTIILPNRRTVGITPAVYKVACGAIENVNLVEVANLSAAITDLKEEGFWIYGADMAGKPIHKVTYNSPAVLVIGSEGFGIREKTAENCDEIVSIPQKQLGNVDSLNASAAASIIMYDMMAKIKLK